MNATPTAAPTTAASPAAATTPERRPSVVLAALTYRRTELLQTLVEALAVQAASVPEDVRLLVVDNNPGGDAREAVERLAAAGHPVHYAHEPEPGIAAGRNRALTAAAEAGDDLLVFIDDDELPSPQWLAHLLRTWHEHPGASGVVGSVVSSFDGAPEPWVAAGDFFRRRRLATGTPVHVAATNNLLVDLHLVRRLGLRFDARFGISGGSDTLFTRQLTSRGAPLVWCDEAEVTDVVPVARTTRAWVLQRALRSGNSWSRTSLVLAGPGPRSLPVRGRLLADGGVRLLGGAVRWSAGVATRSLAQRARGVRTLARGTGMVTGACGWTYLEYRRKPTAG
ncbi:glycosyltransferase family 2 protein [Quadrisphaera setariae]|uniref:glycosyltransferase family 2 protein n=1 Tax=Quadrisphaera setariae TaxID=2593304 RepID=UPI001C9D2D94|nr:glycosyltransferase family 2 protein [Quadrisphaera setariae]